MFALMNVVSSYNDYVRVHMMLLYSHVLMALRKDRKDSLLARRVTQQSGDGKG